MSKENEELFKKQVAELSVLFAAIGYLLQDNDNYDYASRFAYFKHKDDNAKGFSLVADFYSGKFKVVSRITKQPQYFTDLYNDKGNKIESPSAGFSIDRPVANIFQGIVKRFLVDFEEYYKLWIIKWNEHDNYANNKLNTLKDISNALEIELPILHHSNNEPAYQFYPRNQKTINKVYVSGVDHIDISLNLNKAKALKVIEFIKTLE